MILESSDWLALLIFKQRQPINIRIKIGQHTGTCSCWHFVCILFNDRQNHLSMTHSNCWGLGGFVLLCFVCFKSCAVAVLGNEAGKADTKVKAQSNLLKHSETQHQMLTCKLRGDNKWEGSNFQETKGIGSFACFLSLPNCLLN